jgi:hypothetical protein
MVALVNGSDGVTAFSELHIPAKPPFCKQQVDVALESACCKHLSQVLQMF